LLQQQLSEQLKQFTRPNHQQLEKMLVTHLRSLSSTEEYVKLLQLFYSYFGGLEDKINQYIGADLLSDYSQRRKTESIVSDIKKLGGTIHAKAKDHSLPKIENVLHAFGALYVIEGSTLGGKVISQMIAKKLNIENAAGMTFFNGYGDDTELMWASFRELLNSQFQNQSDIDVIISSADDTFFNFKLWIERNA
jgi:heme oxygenase